MRVLPRHCGHGSCARSIRKLQPRFRASLVERLRRPGECTCAIRNGYHLVFWKTGNLEYCAVSDAAWGELIGLVRLLQDISTGDAG